MAERVVQTAHEGNDLNHRVRLSVDPFSLVFLAGNMDFFSCKRLECFEQTKMTRNFCGPANECSGLKNGGVTETFVVNYAPC